jgi:hypothetical protein
MKTIFRHLTGMVLVSIATVILTTIANAQAPANPPVEAPSPSLVKDGKCYEIRTYYAFPGKLEDLHARFRNHTIKLFRKHGMEVVGFWGPTDKEKGSENTLVYVLAYPDRAAREKAWAAFRSDPVWQAVAKESEKNGKLVEKVDWAILRSTDYAPFK